MPVAFRPKKKTRKTQIITRKMHRLTGVERAIFRVPGVKGRSSSLKIHKVYLAGSHPEFKGQALHERRTDKGNVLLAARMKKAQEINSTALKTKKAVSVPQVTKPFNVEVGDHYLFAEIDQFNAAHVFGEALIKSLGLGKVVRTSLVDDVHAAVKKGNEKADVQGFNKWINLSNSKIHNLRESSAQRVFETFKNLLGWREKGECKHFDAILYVRKLGLERRVADFLAKKYRVPKTAVIKAFDELPRIPVAEKAIVVLPSHDNKGLKMATQQKATKDVLHQFFGVPERVINERIKSVYFDVKGLSGLAPEYKKWFKGQLKPLQATQLMYETISHGKTRPKELNQASKFLKQSKMGRNLTNERQASRLVYFNALAEVLNKYPDFKRDFHQGQMEALGAFHSELVKTINYLESEIKQKQSDGLIARELVRERGFQRIIQATERMLKHSLYLMGCQKLVS